MGALTSVCCCSAGALPAPPANEALDRQAESVIAELVIRGLPPAPEGASDDAAQFPVAVATAPQQASPAGPEVAANDSAPDATAADDLAALATAGAATADTSSYLEKQWQECVKPFRGVEPAEQLGALDRFLAALSAKGEGLEAPSEVPNKLVAMRFLRARHFDVEKASSMYKKMVQWRREVVGPALSESLSAEKAARLEALYPSSLVGRDLRGRPCKVFDAGAIDLPDSAVTIDELVRYHIREMEKFASTLAWRDLREPPPDTATTLVSPLEGALVIMDLERGSVQKFLKAMDFWKKIGAIDQDNYPETMGKMAIVNTGWGFGYAWSLAVKFLDPHTVSKIEVIPGKQPRKRLAELVAQDVLPPQYRLNAGQ